MSDVEVRLRGLEARVAQLEAMQQIRPVSLAPPAAITGDYSAGERCHKCKQPVPNWTVTCPHCGYFNSGNL